MKQYEKMTRACDSDCKNVWVQIGIATVEMLRKRIWQVCEKRKPVFNNFVI
jgi:hypothetical protein